MDKDGTGMIKASDLAAMLKRLELSGDSLESQKSEEVIQECDYYGNGMINYSEFLSATLDVGTVLNDVKMQVIF